MSAPQTHGTFIVLFFTFTTTCFFFVCQGLTCFLSQCHSPATNLRMNREYMSAPRICVVSYEKYKVVREKKKDLLFMKKKTFNLSAEMIEKWWESGVFGETGIHNNWLSVLILMLFCAGGAKQHSSKRWTHQGRRSYSTGAYFCHSDQSTFTSCYIMNSHVYS